MDNLAIFTRQVRSRSLEHRKVMKLLLQDSLAGQMASILRQELDSMVRVIYLLSQTPERRNLLIKSSIHGKKWAREKSHARVTDKEMVDLAQNLQGWTQSVYKFGCAFIHLSNLHDYRNRDPLSQLPPQERDDLLEHCRQYHGGPHGDSVSFSDLIPYLPRAFDKIADNLEHYLVALEKNEGHDVNII